jgi:hypothetical protein
MEAVDFHKLDDPQVGLKLGLGAPFGNSFLHRQKARRRVTRLRD